MLELEIDLIHRIREQVPAFTTVGNPSVLAGLNDIGPLLPACIVVPGHGDLSVQSDGRNDGPVIEEQNWDVVVLIGHQYNEQSDGLTEQLASTLMRAVFSAVHGFKVNRASMRSGYVYTGRDTPIYNIAWAEFPMTFFAKRLVNKDDY